jgi:RNA polymerase-binding transcription factor DksA
MTTHAPAVEPTAVDSTYADRPARSPEPTPRSAPGPTAALVALPRRTEIERTTPPEEIRSYLADAEEARRRQLEALPEIDLDPVAAAYRGTVERILDEVRTARRRVEDDLYGVCTVCEGTISADRLQLRPWATACATCVSTERR